MTPEYRLAQIIETIRALQIGTPVAKGGVTLLLQPWPDLYWTAMERQGAGGVNLLQAAAARIERAAERRMPPQSPLRPSCPLLDRGSALIRWRSGGRRQVLRQVLVHLEHGHRLLAEHRL